MYQQKIQKPIDITQKRHPQLLVLRIYIYPKLVKRMIANVFMQPLILLSTLAQRWSNVIQPTPMQRKANRTIHCLQKCTSGRCKHADSVYPLNFVGVHV